MKIPKADNDQNIATKAFGPEQSVSEQARLPFEYVQILQTGPHIKSKRKTGKVDRAQPPSSGLQDAIYSTKGEAALHSDHKCWAKLKTQYRLLMSKFHVMGKTDSLSRLSLHSHIRESRNQRIISVLAILYLILVGLILYSVIH